MKVTGVGLTKRKAIVLKAKSVEISTASSYYKQNWYKYDKDPHLNWWLIIFTPTMTMSKGFSQIRSSDRLLS